MKIETKQVKKERYSPQIGGVIVSHHDMVSPQNGDTRGGNIGIGIFMGNAKFF